jgi:hypothetical protein
MKDQKSDWRERLAVMSPDRQQKVIAVIKALLKIRRDRLRAEVRENSTGATLH